MTKKAQERENKIQKFLMNMKMNHNPTNGILKIKNGEEKWQCLIKKIKRRTKKMQRTKRKNVVKDKKGPKNNNPSTNVQKIIMVKNVATVE